MTERSPKERWQEPESGTGVASSARASSTDLVPASVSVPILERRRRATNVLQPARVTLLARDTSHLGHVGHVGHALGLAEPAVPAAPEREEPRSWDRARWVNEVRRFETAWDVDAPRSSRQIPSAEPSARDLPLAFPPVESVTLVVYEWQNAEPGTLSWQFSDLTAAVTAAGAMRNAVRWAVLAGNEPNVGRARELGLVLAEADAPGLGAGPGTSPRAPAPKI